MRELAKLIISSVGWTHGIINVTLSILCAFLDLFSALIIIPIMQFAVGVADEIESGNSFQGFLSPLTEFGYPWLLLLLCGVTVIRSLVALAQRYHAAQRSAHFQCELRLKFRDLIIESHWPIFNKLNHGDVLNFSSEQINKISNILFMLLQLSINIITFVTIFSFLFYLSVEFLLILVIFFGCLSVILWSVANYTKKVGDQHVLATSDNLTYFNGLIKSKRVLMMMHASNPYTQKGMFVFSNAAKKWTYMVITSNIPSYIVQPLGIIFLCVMLWMADVVSLSVAYFGAFSFGVLRLLPIVQTISSQWNNVVAHLPSAERFANLVDLLSNGQNKHLGQYVVSSIEAVDISINKIGKNCKVKIDQELVNSDQYKTLHIVPGDKLLIRGNSGVGKSFLLNQICGISDVDTSVIHINSIDINKVSRKQFWSQIEYVSQDVVFFGLSLFENLTITAPGTERTYVESLLKSVGLQYLVGRLDDEVLDFGINFSGGERQRLALLRALLSRPQILVLDEVTSGLDQHNERITMEVISSFIPDTIKILIFVSHSDEVKGFANKVLDLCDD